MDYDTWIPRFKVMCSVSGGMTGYRKAYLKKNGKERVFKTRRAAEKAVREFHASPRTNSFATFTAWVVEV